ncbi:MAG: DinB family protein [Acidobacteriia bacterium]|nr:DinB family protein [Terriglobia bacterium]
MEVRNIDSFLSYFESIRKRTMRVLQATPADKLEWRHSEGVFSMGDLARHIAAVERYTFAENVFGRPSRYQGCGTDQADGLENVVAFLEKMHAETVQLLKPLTPEDLERKGITPQGKPAPAGALLRAMIEHEVHHRGEMYVYLALLGVERPPLYGVTEQELRRSSVA